MRIEIGQNLRTNYETGPYRVVSITRECTCKNPIDFFEEGPDMPPHIHLSLVGISQDHNRGEKAWLGWYDEETLCSVVPGCGDRIILCENDRSIQTTLV